MEIPDKVEKAKLTFDGAVINVTINGAWQYLRAERQMALATCGLGAPRTREIAPLKRNVKETATAPGSTVRRDGFWRAAPG